MSFPHICKVWSSHMAFGKIFECPRDTRDPHPVIYLFLLFRGLAIRFPLLSALVSAVIFICILTTILGTCILPLLLTTPQEDDDETEVKIEPKRLASGDILESQSQPPREGRRTSRRRSRSTNASDDKAVMFCSL